MYSGEKTGPRSDQERRKPHFVFLKAGISALVETTDSPQRITGGLSKVPTFSSATADLADNIIEMERSCKYASLSEICLEHTEVTLAVMKLMGVEKGELTTSAGFVIEFKNKPEPSIRILNHDPDPIDKHIIYKAKYTADLANISNKDGWVPFGKFESLVRKFAIDKWQTACGQPSCAVSSPPSSG
ncbi:hypothetical protein OSTOST_17895 [Ostertagia ostertagi]